jgi:hypothetical protein
MKFAAIALISFALLVTPAAAQTDVDPVPWSPKVSVKVRTHQAPASNSTIRSRADPTLEVPFRCFFDGAEPDFRCALQDFPERDPADADLSPGDILSAAREVGMPALRVRIQPSGRTLVNVDTIFYTDPTHLRRTVRLLGHSVRLDATPVRYTWVHGDGTRASTSKPGRPYPAKDVTHQYRRPDDNLRARVDTTYRVRYNVDGGGWTTLGETLTAPGPATTLDVDEAAPVLTH